MSQLIVQFAMIGNHIHRTYLRLSSFQLPKLKELILVGSFFYIDHLNCDNLEYLVIHWTSYYCPNSIDLKGNVLKTLKWFDYRTVKVYPEIGVCKPYLGPFEISEVVLY